MPRMSGWIRTLVSGLCAAVALLFAAPAFAAFPGRDGILAVQPRFGRGIVLVRPDGLGAHRICRSCGAPVRPSWSPDGRELVFAGPAIRIVYPDGSCLNCQFGVARDPVFEPSGALISFLAGGTLTVDGIDGNRQAAPTVLRGVGEAAWARGGLLAVVRHGVIWAGRPGHLRRFGASTQISWAPGGGSIAAVRQGWVVIIRVSDGHLTRLVRGSAPAFSPDGRWIAFVSPGHRLMIVRVGSAPAAPRFVGNVQAVSIDWQPKPRRLVPACAVPSGWTVMASSAGGVVTGDGQLGALDFSNAAPLAYMGCLRATGRWRLLERFTTNNVDSAFSVLSAALAPPYTGLVLASQDEHYGGYSNTLQVFDLRTGTLDPHLGGESTNCDEYSGPPGPCAVFDHVALGSDGVSAAHAGFEAPVGWGSLSIGRLSCAPASTTCVAVDGDLNQFSSASPGAWTKTSFAAIGAPYEIACPSATLCVGVGVGGEIFTTTDPGGGASTWNQTALAGGPHSFNAISCPTVSLCVVTDVAGTVTTSTDPTGGAGAWSTAGLGHHLGSVICSAAPLCFASAFDGTVLSSSDPAGGASTWVVSLG